MRKPRYLLAVALAVVVAFVSAAAPLAQDAAAPPLSPEEMEEFLLNADLSDLDRLDVGVTGSRRASASYGRITHDVHIQSVDIARDTFVAAGARVELNFRDSYRYNIGAYRLAVLLGMDNVPMSVSRRVNGDPAAVTWWVDDVAMSERDRIEQRAFPPNPQDAYSQFYTMYAFDELIQNRDRNPGNSLWTTDWKLWLIDHTRAFRPDVEISKPERLTRISRGLLEGMRALTPESLEEAMDDILTRQERERVLARRDLLVEHFDARISRIGDAVLLD
ncbi:MAG: hypothetical protein OXH75_12950 [Acidobacteria bacterium]|nr:hypothetical protein [Acidobacteriota bacterium]